MIPKKWVRWIDIFTLNAIKVRLIHVNSEQALRYSGKVYPDWGFYQNEVVCDKNIVQLDTVWNVEEHRYTKSKNTQIILLRVVLTN